MLTLSKNEQRREQARKAAGLASVALAAAVCLSGASIYWRHWNEQITTELSDATLSVNGEGLAGYLLIDEVMDWNKAAQRCRLEGMTLATIDSHAKWAEARAQSMNQDVWIGFRTDNEESPQDRSQWNWMSGAGNNGFQRWQYGQPSSSDDDSDSAAPLCAEMAANGQWSNQKCSGSVARKVLCDRSRVYGEFAVHSVGYAEPPLTFDEADSKCRELYNTGLASFSNGEYLRKLVNLWVLEGEMWLGLRVKPGTTWAPNSFSFSNGASNGIPMRWAQNEPNNGGSGREYCVEVRSDGLMNDNACSKRNRNFLCDTLVGGRDVFVSTFEYMSEKQVKTDWAVPYKIVDYYGRQKYSLRMNVRIDALNSNYRNFFFVGTDDWARLPGLWLRPDNARRLHIKQRSKEGWSEGCDTEESQTPALHQWFDLEVYSEPGSFQVKIAGVSVCSESLTFDPYVGQHQIWMARWSPVANVRMREVRLQIGNED